MFIIMHAFSFAGAVLWAKNYYAESWREVFFLFFFSVACHCLYSPCRQVLTKMYNGSVHATVELLTCSGQELSGLETFRSGQAWSPRLKYAGSIFVRCCQFSPLICDIIYLSIVVVVFLLLFPLGLPVCFAPFVVHSPILSSTTQKYR